MIDVEDLAIQAVRLVASSAMNKSGKWIGDWMKQRFKSHKEVSQGVDKVAADPASIAAKKILEGHVHQMLEQYPHVAEELRTLLEQSGVQYAKQSARADAGSTVKQIQGNNNRA